MKRPGEILLRFCAVAMLAGAPWIGRGQDDTPVTRVVPAQTAPPAPAPDSPPAAQAISLPSPIPAKPPAPALTGTMPLASGTVPSVSGTGTIVSGSTPAISGTGMAAAPSPAPPSPYSIEIDLGAQRAYLLEDGHKLAVSAISSGRTGHLTPTGNFEVIQKDLNHFSNLYGKFVEKDSGRVVKSGADAAMPVPKGCIFVPAPMKWFMRFDGAAGMHAGILPGYAASHGCVRMPASKAELFYNTVEVGTPVHVFGTAPVREFRDVEAPHPRIAMATPKPTPKPRHGWWF